MHELAADGVVDPLFGQYVQQSGAEAALVLLPDHAAAAEAIRHCGAYGTAIDFERRAGTWNNEQRGGAL